MQSKCYFEAFYADGSSFVCCTDSEERMLRIVRDRGAVSHRLLVMEYVMEGEEEGNLSAKLRG